MAVQKSKMASETPVGHFLRSGRSVRVASIVASCTLCLLLYYQAFSSQPCAVAGHVVLGGRASAVSGSLFTGSQQRTYKGRLVLGHKTPQKAQSMHEPNAGPQSKKWAVCTTVFKPSEAILQMVALQGWSMVVVGDVDAAPFNITAPNLVYLDAAAQQQLKSFEGVVDLLPWKHFGRKNVGYLYAITQGAELIWDFDDDNVLKSGVTPVMPSINVFHVETGCPAFNPYPIMGGPSAADPHMPAEWPRGFPLELLQERCNVTLTAGDASQVAVVQSLADNDPDVDAIFRLTRGVPMHFANSKRTLVVPANVLTPWNAQATLVAKPAFFTLLLPITVHGRVSDIWRSYIAQRLLWDVGCKVAFAPPMVDQYRSPHNYLADMQAEEPLYLKSGQLVNFLRSWQGSAPTLLGRFEELVIQLYERMYVELEDVHLAQQWLLCLEASGYSAPALQGGPTLPPLGPAGAVHKVEEPTHSPTTSSVGLFVPVTSRFVQELRDQLLFSMQLFQPFSSPMTVVMDDEKLEDHESAKQLSQHMSSMEISHSIHFAQPAEATYHGKGHSRQQLLMFWADNFTTAEYVGFVDTDTVFVTRVVDSDVFDGAKPRIIGLVGRPSNDWWAAIPPSTHAAIGQPEVMRCMTYFPVVIKRAHLQQLRTHVEVLHGKSFDLVFRNFSASEFSQFNIMCNYLWYHHRDAYAWSLHQQTPGWNGSVNGQVPAQELQQLLSNPQLTKPVVRTSIHAGYMKGGIAAPMLQGFCLSGGSVLRPELCLERSNATQLQHELFLFEFNDWSWDKRCFAAQVEHYKAVTVAVQGHLLRPWNLTLVDALVRISNGGK